MMKCSATLEHMDALIRGTLSAGEMQEIRAHIAACDECRATYDLEMRLVNAGAAAPVCAPSADFAARVVQTWQIVPVAELMNPFEIVKRAFVDTLNAAFDRIFAPFQPVVLDTRETLACARQTVGEAFRVLIAVMKQVLFSRFLPETT